MLRQTHCHVSFTRLGISSSNNKLYRFNMSTNVRGGNLMWARMSGVVIWCEHECPYTIILKCYLHSVESDMFIDNIIRCLRWWGDVAGIIPTKVDWKHLKQSSWYLSDIFNWNMFLLFRHVNMEMEVETKRTELKKVWTYEIISSFFLFS